MRNGRLTLAVIFVAAVWAGTAQADPSNRDRNPHPPMGNNQHPAIGGGHQVKPAAPAPRPAAGRPASRPSASRPGSRPSETRQLASRPAAPFHADRARHDKPHGNINVNLLYYFGRSYPYGYAYGYAPYYGYTYGYPYFYPQAYLPPYVPAPPTKT